MEAEKITVIVGTNRPESNSEKLAGLYSKLLITEGAEVSIYNLIDLPKDFAFNEMYGKRSDSMRMMIEEFIDPVSKFAFVIPEYNGGFPGVLKAFVDCIHPSSFYNKKAGLIGLSSGRAGSLRGMDQFTNVLNYLKVNVFHSKPKLSGFESLIDEKGEINDPDALLLLRKHARDLLRF